jgi:hypothetical protein
LCPLRFSLLEADHAGPSSCPADPRIRSLDNAIRDSQPRGCRYGNGLRTSNEGGYLRQSVAILCRLADALTSRISRTALKVSDFFLGDAKISASALIFRSLMPIRFHISWFSLAPMSATRFVVAPSSNPCHHEIRAQRRNATSPVGAA